MKTVIGKVVLLLMLSAGMMNVFARPGEERGDRRDYSGQRQEQRDNARAADASRQQQYAPPGTYQEDARRQGHMSPEERRALRRQIDEAGRDIYAPRR
jgi:hypothetical protein